MKFIFPHHTIGVWKVSERYSELMIWKLNPPIPSSEYLWSWDTFEAPRDITCSELNSVGEHFWPRLRERTHLVATIPEQPRALIYPKPPSLY